MIENKSMNRVLAALSVAVALCWSHASHTHGENKIFRIGFIALVSAKITEQWHKASVEELRKLGY